MDEKEKPKRKDLRLKQYSYSTRGAYFITICTQDRKNILSHVAVVGADKRVVEGADPYGK